MTHMVIVTVLGFIVTIGTIIYNKGEWKGTVNNTLKELAQKIEALTQRVDKIYEVFLQRGGAATRENKSPIRLNQLGQELANKLDLDSLADRVPFSSRLRQKLLVPTKSGNSVSDMPKKIWSMSLEKTHPNNLLQRISTALVEKIF